MLIVFGGSSFLFPAFFGAMAAIEEHGFKDLDFAGTSGGAIAAAVFAAGMAPARALELVIANPPSSLIATNRRFWQPARVMGMFSLAPLATFIAKHVPATFADSPRPLTIITADVDTHTEFIFSPLTTPRASIASAVRASCSLPFLFTPVTYDGRLLVDGGIISTFSPDLVPGGENVIGIRALSTVGPKKIASRRDFVVSVVTTMIAANEREHLEDAPRARIISLLLPHASLNVDMSGEEMEDLYDRGWKQTHEAL